jgi:hypothetical protein
MNGEVREEIGDDELGSTTVDDEDAVAVVATVDIAADAAALKRGDEVK